MDRQKKRTIKDVTEGLEGTSTSVGPLHCFCTCQPQSVEKLHEVLVDKFPDSEKYKKPGDAITADPLGPPGNKDLTSQKGAKSTPALLAVAADAKSAAEGVSRAASAASAKKCSVRRSLWKCLVFLACAGVALGCVELAMQHKKFKAAFEGLQDGQCHLDDVKSELVEPESVDIRVPDTSDTLTVPAIHSKWHAGPLVECLLKVSVDDDHGADLTKARDPDTGVAHVLFYFPSKFFTPADHHLTCTEEAERLEKSSSDFTCSFSSSGDVIFAVPKAKLQKSLPVFELLMFSLTDGVIFQIFLGSILFIVLAALLRILSCIFCCKRSASAREVAVLDGSDYVRLEGDEV
mmetsp:Transcript_69900/g.167795  ORF Transcript_69900/g.167795 Transcript_69900/m.167795 type:complete len:348 (-) Transcript_69900:106-1149(-)